MKETKMYKVECRIHIDVCVEAESEEEAREKAKEEAVDFGEWHDFATKVIDEWDD